MKPIVFHHGNCPDGFGAALAAWLAFKGDVDFVPLEYGHPLPTPEAVRGREVFVFDFSFEPDLTHALAQSAKSFILLDHHESAMKQWVAHGAEMASGRFALDLPNGFVRFNMNRSGAVLAWEHLIGQPLPALFRFIEENDLGKTFQGTAIQGAEAHAARMSVVPYDFGAWLQLLEQQGVVAENPGQHPQVLKDFIHEGELILSSYRNLANTVEAKGRPITLGGIDGLVVNFPDYLKAITNELGHAMAVRSGTFGAIWTADGDAVKVSLRAAGQCNVSEIATQFGGGGHPNAAGFNLKMPEFLKLLSPEAQPPRMSF